MTPPPLPKQNNDDKYAWNKVLTKQGENETKNMHNKTYNGFKCHKLG